MILAVDSFHPLSKMSHGDLKPDNMVITELFKVALIDFCHSEQITARLNHETGTLVYQPPEIRQDIHLDYSAKKADIWCLGICLFIGLFSGRPYGDMGGAYYQRIR